MMGLTEMQQLAVDMRGRPILVAAAAGSGKTSVLSRRVISLLAGDKGTPPIDADRMLIVTFTKAASAELRERVTGELEKRIAEEPDNELLQRQRRLLAQAQISTIDSLCKTILEQNFEKMGLPPKFSIIQGGALRQLQGDVLEELLTDRYEHPTEGFEKVRFLCEHGTDSKIREIIEAVYETARTEPDFSLWMKSCTLKMEQALEETKQEEERLASFFRKEADRLVCALSGLEGLAAAEEEILISAKKKLTEAAKAKIVLTVERYAGFEQVMRDCMAALAEAKTLSELAKALGTLPKKPTKKEFKELRESERLEPWYALWEDSDRLARQLAGFSLSNAAHDRLVLDAVQEIYRMTAEFHERMTARKREKNQLDFADLEQNTVALLAEGSLDEKGNITFVQTGAAREIAAGYDCVMVDECQDNNRVQDIIFRMLTDKTDHLFMVGDVKQSIYRFRHAKPELFVERQEQYASPEEAEEGEPVRIVLGHNFRSRRSVIDTVNFLFGRLMTPESGGVLYDSEAAMYAGRSYPPLPAPFSDEAELHILDNEGSTKAEGGGIDQEEYIAEEMDRLLSSGYPVTDAETGELRPCRYSDFLVLLRSGGRLGLMLKALEAHHISYHTGSLKAFYETTEIRACMAMLRVSRNPQDDFALWCFLLSPFALFDFDDAAVLRLISNEKGCTYIYDALRLAAEEEENPVCRKAKKALALIEELQNRSLRMTVSDFLQFAFAKTHYPALLAAGEDGSQKNANLDLLCKEARSWEEDNISGIDGFIQAVDRMGELGEDIPSASALEQNDDVAEVMTIHGSKGLEAPICILAHCEGKFNRSDTMGGYLLDADLGLTLQYCDEEACIRYYNRYGETLKNKITAASTAEELRLLYVAVTRAREKLICVGSCPNLASRLKTLTKTAVPEEGDTRLPEAFTCGVSSFMDWLIGGLVPGMPQEFLEERGYPVFAQQVPFAEVLSRLTGDSGQPACRVKIVKASEYKPSLPAEAGQKKKEKGEEAEKGALERLLKPYPFEAVTAVPAKTSVTALTRLLSPEKNPPAEPVVLHDAPETLYEEQVGNVLFLESELPEEKPDPADLVLQQAGLERPEFLSEERGRVTGAMRGTATHAFLQFADLEAAQRDPEAEIARLVRIACLTQEDADLINRYQLRRFLSGRLCMRILAAGKEGRLLREYAFIHELPASLLKPDLPESCRPEQIVVQGIADCILLGEEGLTLIDYKTDNLKTEAEFTERYRTQLLIYRDALNLLFSEEYPGRKAVSEILIYSLRLGKEIVIPTDLDL